MIKRRSLIFLLGVGTILTIGLSSRSADSRSLAYLAPEANQASAAQAFFALGQEAPLTRTASSETQKAFDIEEGDSIYFNGLSLTVASISKDASCADPHCFEVTLHLSEGGEMETLSGTVSEVLSYKGYAVKVSQVAPMEVVGGGLRRAVLLLSGK